LGKFRVSAVLMLGALLELSMGAWRGAGWLTGPLALALRRRTAALVLEFLMNHEVVDPLFRRGRSVNVIGHAASQPEQRGRSAVMLSGHHDSAWENTWY